MEDFRALFCSFYPGAPLKTNADLPTWLSPGWFRWLCSVTQRQVSHFGDARCSSKTVKSTFLYQGGKCSQITSKVFYIVLLNCVLCCDHRSLYGPGKPNVGLFFCEVTVGDTDEAALRIKVKR